MKKNLSVIIFGAMLALGANTSAQTAHRHSIFDELQASAPGKGRVIIDQPAGIRDMIGTQIVGSIETASDGTTFVRYQGFRVQVFSGNDQRTSKDEAAKRKKEVEDIMPDIAIYLNYDAPFWRVRVGDFTEREEAYEMQQKLMQALPNYRKEMYIVREEVKLLLSEAN